MKEQRNSFERHIFNFDKRQLMKHIIIIIIYLSIINPLYSQCDRMQDSLSLVEFFNNFNGPNWQEPWPLDQPFSQWEGIEVSVEGCIKKIALPIDSNISGGL